MKSSVQNPSLIPWLLIECKFFSACVQATHATALHSKDAFVITGPAAPLPPRRLSSEESASSASSIPGSGRSLEEEMATLVFLPGKSHGQRSLVGCSVSGLKKSDMTEVTELSLVREPATVLACINILPTEWKNRLKTRSSRCFLEKFRVYIRPAYTVKS